MGAGPLLPGAYPPPPPTRCSRPASLRRSPKHPEHCVQQQFPIACRPGKQSALEQQERLFTSPAVVNNTLRPHLQQGQ